MSPRYQVKYTYNLAHKKGTALLLPIFMLHANIQQLLADILYQIL
jgi:hypothetical protein